MTVALAASADRAWASVHGNAGIGVHRSGGFAEYPVIPAANFGTVPGSIAITDIALVQLNSAWRTDILRGVDSANCPQREVTDGVIEGFGVDLELSGAVAVMPQVNHSGLPNDLRRSVLSGAFARTSPFSEV